MGGKNAVLKGKLLGMEEDNVRIETEDQVLTIPLSSIRRTKLDG
jgi:ribosome maturation factor RimP